MSTYQQRRRMSFENIFFYNLDSLKRYFYKIHSDYRKVLKEIFVKFKIEIKEIIPAGMSLKIIFYKFPCNYKGSFREYSYKIQADKQNCR